MIREEIFGRSAKIVKMVGNAKKYAKGRTPVLITGERGIGKVLLGMFIHENSERAQAPCMIVDCSQKSEDVENEVLGFRDEESGRFNKGVLERANCGTVILKNVDCLNEDFQKKLFRIVNELDDYDINVKIIATTTKNLSKLVGAGRFLRVLYLYLSERFLSVQPLRERREDIEEIFHSILNSVCTDQALPIPFVTSEVMDKIRNYYWTNNITEMRNVIESTMANLQGNSISVKDLIVGDKKVVHISSDDDEDGFKLMSLKDAEKLLIRKALIHTSENRTQAAKILGVSIRTLRNKINEYRSSGSNYFVNLR